MKLMSAMTRTTLCIMLCVPANQALAADLKTAARLAELLDGIAFSARDAASQRSLETAWHGTGKAYDDLRDAPAPVSRLSAAMAGTRAASPAPQPRGLHASVPPVPAAGPVVLKAEDKKDDNKKEEAPPPDPKAVVGAAIGMAIGALIGLLVGGPIGLLVGLLIGALIGAAAGKMMPDKPKPEPAPPAPPAPKK